MLVPIVIGRELLLRFADAGVLPVSREKLEFLVAGLRHSGAEGP
jgi:hypothetical protein